MFVHGPNICCSLCKINVHCTLVTFTFMFCTCAYSVYQVSLHLKVWLCDVILVEFFRSDVTLLLPDFATTSTDWLKLH